MNPKVIYSGFGLLFNVVWESAAAWMAPVVYLLVVVATGGMAVLLLVSDAKRNWNQILALFLVLVSINFLSQAISTLNTRYVLMYGAPLVSDVVLRSAVKIGAITFIMDPAVLAYFVSIFPRRTAFAKPWYGPVILGLVTALFLYFEFQRSFISGWWGSRPNDAMVPLLFFLWAGSLYLFAVWRMVGNHVTEPSQIMGRQVQFITAGLMIAMVPRIATIPIELRNYWSPVLQLDALGRYVVFLAVFLLVTWATYLGLYAWGRHKAESVGGYHRRHARVFFLVAIALVAFSIYTALHFLAQYNPSQFFWNNADHLFWFTFFDLQGIFFSVRWFIFTVVVFYGIIRFQTLAVRPQAIRTTVMGTTLVLLILVGVVLTNQYGAWLGGAFTATVAAGGAVLVYHGFNRQNRVSVPSYLRHRALDAYRSNLAAALAGGTITADEEQKLSQARRRLGINRREHEMLLSIAEADEAESGRRPLLLGRFEQIRRLGSGGHATVFLARDPDEDTLVAVKKYHIGEGNQDSVEAARREVKVAQRVSHPNLIAIHDINDTPDGMAIVLEYAEGGSLREYMLQVGLPAPAEVQRILAQVLDGLHALHEAGLIHGDLKPENVLLDANGDIKLADFGSAGRPGTRRSNDRTAAVTAPGPGTVLYQAPELRRDGQPTRASDLYSVGVIAMEALVGERPHERGKSNDTPSSKVPVGWERLLAGALAENPDERFPSAAAMRTQLQALSVLRRPGPALSPKGAGTPGSTTMGGDG